MAELQVELVAADRQVWTGEAQLVVARTSEGDMGIMPGHEPVLALLAEAPVRIRTTDGELVLAAAHGGFLSVSQDKVKILAEAAELAEEIDVAQAERDLERLRAGGGSAEPGSPDGSEDDADARAMSRAETRMRVAGSR